MFCLLYKCFAFLMVKRRGARNVSNKHHNHSSVSIMLQDLKWTSLEQRKKEARVRLTMIYIIENNKVAISKEECQYHQQECIETCMHDKCFQQPSASSDYRQKLILPNNDPGLEHSSSWGCISTVIRGFLASLKKLDLMLILWEEGWFCMRTKHISV